LREKTLEEMIDIASRYLRVGDDGVSREVSLFRMALVSHPETDRLRFLADCVDAWFTETTMSGDSPQDVTVKSAGCVYELSPFEKWWEIYDEKVSTETKLDDSGLDTEMRDDGRFYWRKVSATKPRLVIRKGKGEGTWKTTRDVSDFG
jgi:hypothetical protein